MRPGDQIIRLVKGRVVPLEEPDEGVLHGSEVDRKEGPRDVERGLRRTDSERVRQEHERMVKR